MIRAAGCEDAALVTQGLRALAVALDEPFLSDAAQVARLMQAGVVRAELAEEGALVGLALWSAFLSTSRGQVGAYVSDLWVADGARGRGLGPQLLSAVRGRLVAEYGGGFLRLNVHADNPAARAFYERLGFGHKPDELWLTLEGAPLEALA